MSWFRLLLASLEIVYYLVRCIACGARTSAKKGEGPPGWFRRADGCWLCPRCGEDAFLRQ